MTYSHIIYKQLERAFSVCPTEEERRASAAAAAQGAGWLGPPYKRQPRGQLCLQFQIELTRPAPGQLYRTPSLRSTRRVQKRVATLMAVQWVVACAQAVAQETHPGASSNVQQQKQHKQVINTGNAILTWQLHKQGKETCMAAELGGVFSTGMIEPKKRQYPQPSTCKFHRITRRASALCRVSTQVCAHNRSQKQPSRMLV